MYNLGYIVCCTINYTYMLIYQKEEYIDMMFLLYIHFFLFSNSRKLFYNKTTSVANNSKIDVCQYIQDNYLISIRIILQIVSYVSCILPTWNMHYKCLFQKKVSHKKHQNNKNIQT